MDAAAESMSLADTLGSEIQVFFGNIRTYEKQTLNWAGIVDIYNNNIICLLAIYKKPKLPSPPSRLPPHECYCEHTRGGTCHDIATAELYLHSHCR